MSSDTKRLAGILLLVFPTVMYGGLSILSLLTDSAGNYADNQLRQNFWRAGHAHAGAFLILALICFLYVDQTNLPFFLKKLIRNLIPLSAIFLPAGFFLSMLLPSSTEPNGWIYLIYIGAVCLASSLVLLGIGLLRKDKGS